MLVAMAGLPASGKSAIARRLEAELPGFRLDKDEVRAALFRSRVDYSDAQNDLCVEVMFEVAGYLLARGERVVILDGRTFSKRAQVAALVGAARAMGAELRIVECVCSEATARERLAAAQGAHPAADRDVALYLRVRERFEPIEEPKLVLDTDARSLEDCVAEALAYLRG